MKLIKLSAAVLNQTPLDWRGNKARILGAIEEARSQGASVLCLPELCISGYGCEDTFLSPNTLRQAFRVLAEILPDTRGMIVSLGLPVRVDSGIFNMAALAVNGRLRGFVGKKHLAGDGIHYEPRWFKPWPGGTRTEVAGPDGRPVPAGDLYFDIAGIRFGFEICEDAWVAARPGIQLARRGVDVILNPSASHFAFGKIAIRQRFVLEGSRAFGCSYAYANLLGNEAGRAIYDGEAMIASGGRFIAIGPRFAYADFRVTSGVIDVDATRLLQSRTAAPAWDGGPEPACIRVPDFEWPRVAPARQEVEVALWERSDSLKEEEFARAVPLALFDYLRKSRSRGFVVSLSGGADSSAVACLVSLMVRAGVAELGLDAFRRKLGGDHLEGCRDVRDLTRALLTTAYQSTRNSGPVTRAAARAVAEAIGSDHHELDVGPLHAGYVDLVSKALGRELVWSRDDLALQNIQARVRSPGIWMLANVKQALLLSTSNRSEAAVGYATMDGDTSGGLAPIAGIDKAWLRHWLRWLEREGPHGLGPIPALAAVNAQAPTAELRPPDSRQTDEADLMPYPLLDAIERAAIRDKQSPVEVFELMRAQFPDLAPRDLGRWVERFFVLWCRNQWKRERYAPSFHVDDENLDPKTWCRFPILSGGYERELQQLRDHVRALSA